MTGLLRKLSIYNHRGILRNFVFFALFYLYIWLEVKPHLIYHGGGELTNFPVFYRGGAFLHEFLSYPGGLIEYFSAFLSQFLYYSWAGAIILTVHAWLICICTSCFLKAVKAQRFHFVSFVPAILLLITYNKYTYHFTTTLALLAALVFLCLYVKAAPKSKLLSVVFFLLLSVLLYMLAGGAYLLFAIVCGIYEMLFRRQLWTGLLYLLSAAVLAYVVGVLVFNVSIPDAYTELLPVSWKILFPPDRKIMVEAVYGLYLLLPAIAITLGLWRYFAGTSTLLPSEEAAVVPKSDKAGKKDKKVSGGKSSTSHLQTQSKPKWTIDFELLIIFAIAAAAAFLSHDYKRKTIFEVDYHVCHRNWKQVLSASRHYPHNIFIYNAVNRALYHTGRLPYDMFSYPQHPRALMLSSTKDMLEHWRRFDTYYDLGTINHCESALVESLELYGERPMILRRLAMVRMAKGDINVARIYLGALNKTLFYSDWAKGYLKQLETDPTLSADGEIQRLRALMPEKDEGAIRFSVEKVFSELLEKNRQNHMAFEYLMAWYMLNRQLDKFIENVGRLNNFDYPEIPRYYEEALLTYMYNRRKRVEVPGYKISDESQQRFNRFLLTADKYGTNEKAAFGELAAKFGDTYFFYYVYSLSGL